MSNVHLGFDGSQVLTVRIKPNWTALPAGLPTGAFYHDLFEGLG